MTNFRITVNPETGDFSFDAVHVEPGATALLFSGVVSWLFGNVNGKMSKKEFRQLLIDTIDEVLKHEQEPKKFAFPLLQDSLSSDNGKSAGFLNQKSGFKSL